MRKLLFIAAIGMLAYFAVPQALQAQSYEGKSIVEVEGTSVDYSSTRSTNPNIKIVAPDNDKNPLPASQKKGNKKATGKECEIIFDNYTGYYIEVYIDGIYKGTVGEWGTLYVTARGGYTKIYALTTGGTKEWKAEGNCEGNYVWKLK